MKLTDKKTILDVENIDSECLRWAICAALSPARTSSYSRNDGLDFTGSNFPMPFSHTFLFCFQPILARV